MEFPGKLMNKTRKNNKKPNLGPDFGLFGPYLVPKIFFAGFTSSKCYTLLQAIIVCNFKEN